jgi:hypothetical protein
MPQSAIQEPAITTPPKLIRCAIYTRKSTEEGLQQEFNSLDAQREAGEAFIGSQKHEGWQLVPEHFDDGGFTGGNMDRPALQELLDLARAKKIDCVVVYKVDRLTQSHYGSPISGQPTPIPGSAQPVYIYAMDAQSFAQFATNNRGAIANSQYQAIQEGHPLVQAVRAATGAA